MYIMFIVTIVESVESERLLLSHTNLPWLKAYLLKFFFFCVVEVWWLIHILLVC